MKSVKRHLSLACCLLVAATGPGAAREDAHPVSPPFHEVECPAAPGAGEPFLFTAPDGAVTLSWVEPAGDGHRLRFAAWKDSAWGEPRTVAEGEGWFVNWADVPSVVASGDGRMAAHWLVKSGDDPYAYDVRVAQSFDGGSTWGKPVTPHTDGTATEHGFASLIFAGDYLHVVWLDGRKYADERASDETAVRAARIDREGKVSGEVEVDPRACDCCPTAIAPVDGGFVVAYRDRSAGEIRDIATARYVNGAWEAPRIVAADGWKIDGCPVNGPALASDGTDVAVAWFTMAGDAGVVRGAWSKDGGRTFEAPRRLDGGGAIGRVAATASDGVVRVSWIATVGDGASILFRTLAGAATDATTDAPVGAIGSTDAGRSSGYPRIAGAGGRIVAAWTEPGKPSRLRTAVGKP